MTSRLLNTRCQLAIPGLCSAQQRGKGVGFEAVVGGAAANQLAPQGRSFPGLDQAGGNVIDIDTPPTAAGPQAFREGVAPAFQDADQLGAHWFASATEFER